MAGIPEPHDIKCHAQSGCVNPDGNMSTCCDKCENNHCQCTLCKKKREV